MRILSIWAYLGGYCPSPTRYCTLAGTILKSLKDQPPSLSSQLFQGNDEYGDISEFHEQESWLHFICCKVVSLVISNDVWMPMMMDKVSRKFTHGSFDRRTASRGSILGGSLSPQHGYSPVGLGECKFTLLSPCITFLPATWPLFTELNGKWQKWLVGSSPTSTEPCKHYGAQISSC